MTSNPLDIHRVALEGVAVAWRGRALPLAAPEDEPLEISSVALRGHARPDDRGLVLEARLRGRVRARCSRCLEPCEIVIRTRFRLILVGDAVEFGGKDDRLRAENAELFYAVEGKADMGEVAREQILLHLPLKPVCDEACRGLCPACGADRNRIECGCREHESDPRLEPLLDLKRRLPGG